MSLPALPNAMTREPAVPHNRIVVLDVLRGMALLGMFVVHIWDAHGTDGSRLGDFVGSAISLLVEDKAFTIFAILFGAGFAIQLRQAQSRGEHFTPLFLRRLFGLAVFGFVAEGIFGYNVLIGYAVWGVGLLLVWRWSTKALLITVVLCAMSLDLYNIAAFTYRRATLGIEGGRRAGAQLQTEYRVARETMDQARSQSSFPKLVAARLRFMRSFWAQPFSFTPWNFFVRLLLGLLAVRLGLWDRPREHRRLILSVMAFGFLSWVVAQWVLPLPTFPTDSPDGSIFGVFLKSLHEGFRLFRDAWLAFTYIGAVLLIVASGRLWERRPESLCNLRPDGAYQLHDSDHPDRCAVPAIRAWPSNLGRVDPLSGPRSIWRARCIQSVVAATLSVRTRRVGASIQSHMHGSNRSEARITCPWPVQHSSVGTLFSLTLNSDAFQPATSGTAS